MSKESASSEWLSEDETPEWLKKCMTCKHSYKRIGDDETMYCRKRNGKCEYKAYKSKTEDKQ